MKIQYILLSLGVLVIAQAGWAISPIQRGLLEGLQPPQLKSSTTPITVPVPSTLTPSPYGVTTPVRGPTPTITPVAPVPVMPKVQTVPVQTITPVVPLTVPGQTLPSSK